MQCWGREEGGRTGRGLYRCAGRHGGERRDGRAVNNVVMGRAVREGDAGRHLCVADILIRPRSSPDDMDPTHLDACHIRPLFFSPLAASLGPRCQITFAALAPLDARSPTPSGHPPAAAPCAARLAVMLDDLLATLPAPGIPAPVRRPQTQARIPGSVPRHRRRPRQHRAAYRDSHSFRRLPTRVIPCASDRFPFTQAPPPRGTLGAAMGYPDVHWP